MDLKSLFSRDKAGGSGSSELPQPPSIREVIEDIESCSKNDPVLHFANYLQKLGSRKTSYIDIDLDGNIAESRNLSLRGSSDQRKKISESEDNPGSSTATDSPSSLKLADDSSSNFPEGEDSVDSIYYKLRQFISLNEQTQGVALDVETKVKAFEKDNKQFLNEVNAIKSESDKS